MPVFKCSKCSCVENTATSNYWNRPKDSVPLCSECDPEIKKWHGIFKKRSAVGVGYWVGEDGFLYDFKYPPTHTELIEPVLR